jgi:putative MATE family efflux protein
LLKLLQTPEDILPDAVSYLKILLVGGGVGKVVYNNAAALLRAVGDSRTPLIFLITACLLSMVLDFVFILGLGFGVEGAAIATVIAQVLSALACLVYMLKKSDIFKLKKPDWTLRNETLMSILKIGLPVSFQTILLAVGDMTISAVVNSFGPDVVAAYAAAGRIMMTVMMFAMNLAMAYAVFAGQNLGAGNIERIKHGFRSTILIMLSLSALMTALVFIFGDTWVRLFIAEGDAHIEAVVSLSRGAIRIPAAFYVFLGGIWLYNYTLRGMGDITIPFVSGMLELVCKVGLSVALGYWFGYMGVWYAMPLGWVVGIIPSVIRFHRMKWVVINK